MKTRLPRLATATVLAVSLAGPAALAQNTLEKRLTVDPAALKADQERQIVEMVQEAYGRTAVVNTGTGLPPALDDMIVEGAMLPQGAPVSPLPDKISGRLPQITPGAEWVGVGKHLVELGPNREMETVIYHALP